MSEGIYKTILELKEALERGEIDRERLIGINCKYELFIQQGGALLFSAYYGTNNACMDICTLLGIEMVEE